MYRIANLKGRQSPWPMVRLGQKIVMVVREINSPAHVVASHLQVSLERMPHSVDMEFCGRIRGMRDRSRIF